LEGGIEEVCVITSKSKPLIEQYVTKEFGDKLKLTFVYQEVMNGTAKAVYLAKDFVGESSFLYANPDCLFSSFLPTKELIKKSEGQNVLSVFHGTEEELSKFSVDEFVSQPPERGKLNKISRILEKPTAEETTSRYMGY
jgi:UTP-glucose-1-phosphate uridylyltransferase